MKLQHTFTINHFSEIDQQHYNGTFTCKKLSIRDTSKLGVRTAQLNGGMHFDDDTPGYGVDGSTNGINHMIAMLELALVNKPSWFDIDELVDLELLSKVYGEVRSFEASFRRSASQPNTVDNKNSAEGSPAPQTSPNGPRALGKVVDHEVSATLEP